MKKAKNIWTQRSIELADQSDSLDQLFKIDPISQNAKRPISKKEEEEIDEAFHAKEEAGIKVIKALLKLKRFPLKDSYAAYLRKDPSSLKRNPQTVERIFGALNELGLKAVLANCEAPIEANRQNGPLFKNWIEKKSLGCEVCQTAKELLEYPGNCVLSASDKEMGNFARECLGYQRKKGLDFCAKFNGVYVIGEAKFITAYGGHQNAQFQDALAMVDAPLTGRNEGEPKVVKIAIVDGVVYINAKEKMHREILKKKNRIVLSALLLRDFLFSL